MEDTTSDFWQMIWEQEVDVIAMLTDLAVSDEVISLFTFSVICSNDLIW